MNENARRPISPKGDYKVGYGRPPQHTRFQPGRSGNPRGRPKRLQPTVAEIFSQELYRTLSLREGEKVTTVPALQALVRSCLASGIKGNASALRALAPLVELAKGLNHRNATDLAEQASPTEVARAVAAVFAEAEAEEAREAQLKEDETNDADSV